MYDGLADNYNSYGTSSRSSFYSKFQAGSGSWGYPVRSRFLGACGHSPWLEQEKVSWLLRRGVGGSISDRSICLAIISRVVLSQPPSGQSGYF